MHFSLGGDVRLMSKLWSHVAPEVLRSVFQADFCHPPTCLGVKRNTLQTAASVATVRPTLVLLVDLYAHVSQVGNSVVAWVSVDVVNVPRRPRAVHEKPRKDEADTKRKGYDVCSRKGYLWKQYLL